MGEHRARRVAYGDQATRFARIARFRSSVPAGAFSSRGQLQQSAADLAAGAQGQCLVDLPGADVLLGPDAGPRPSTIARC
ncbi:MAG: hypothetical protein U0835_02945 [Isosphaeraceae bacterium]